MNDPELLEDIWTFLDMLTLSPIYEEQRKELLERVEAVLDNLRTNSQ